MAVRGIGDSTHVIAVDHAGGQFATRLWWALNYYGHEFVSVLDGGWNRWVDEGGRSSRAGSSPRRVHAASASVVARHRRGAGRLLGRGRPRLAAVDARDPAQYTGARRRGLRAATSPAINVPAAVLRPGGGFLPLDEIRRRVQDHGLRPDRYTWPIATAASRPPSSCSIVRWVTPLLPTTTARGTSGATARPARGTVRLGRPSRCHAPDGRDGFPASPTGLDGESP
jgi:hypothetical protein